MQGNNTIKNQQGETFPQPMDHMKSAILLTPVMNDGEQLKH